jgi:hypothetical protein
MKVLDIIVESFEYKQYTPVIRKIVNDSFTAAYKEKRYDLKGKINDFLNQISNKIDQQVLATILEEHPLVINDIPIATLSLSFETNTEQVSDPVESVEFLPEASFRFDETAKQVYISLDANINAIAWYLFKAEDPKQLTKGLNRFESNLVGKLMHEVRHHVQKYKISQKQGSNVKSHLLNKFYTGNPRSNQFNKNAEYQTDAGYFLNAHEIDAWSADIANDISNQFGNNVKAMNQYLNNASKGIASHIAGKPVSTTLDSYYRTLFDPKTKTNTDKNTIWRRIIKKVYKDLQQHQNPA